MRADSEGIGKGVVLPRVLVERTLPQAIGKAGLGLDSGLLRALKKARKIAGNASEA